MRLTLLGMVLAASSAIGGVVFHVSPSGDDGWSGSEERPFRSLLRAQKAVREAGVDKARRVVVHAGTYYLSEPLVFGREDSGRPGKPVMWEVAPGDRVVVSGGELVKGEWTRRQDGSWSLPVGNLASKADFRQLRLGDEMLRLARFPNFDPVEPTRGGWLFSGVNPELTRDIDLYKTVANIHNAGDWMEWDIKVPASGTYVVWVNYAHNMKAYKRPLMDGVTALIVDDGKDVPLVDMPDTGGWSNYRWGRCATLELTAGTHRLRWINRKGGGLDLNLFVLCDKLDWRPETHPPKMPGNANNIIVPCALFKAKRGNELTVGSMSGKDSPPNELPFPLELVPADWSLAGSQVMLFPAWGWVGGIVQVEGVDREQGILKLTGKNASQPIRRGNRFYIENVVEALDAPGEFVLDRDKGELLLIPPSDDFRERDMCVPVLKELVKIIGSEHLVLKGFRFRDTTYSLDIRSMYTPDDGAVCLENASHITLEDCEFSKMGGYGVKFSNKCRYCRILSSHFHDLGQGGVQILGDNSTQCSYLLISGCHFHDLGRIYKHVSAVAVDTGYRVRISYNDIHDVPRYGISFKSYSPNAYSHECIAEYNDIRRTNCETNDTGGIETLGRDKQQSGNVIRYNLVLDSIGMKHTPDGKLLSPFYTWGIYLDDFSSGTTVFGNIVARNTRGGCHVHLGFDNTIENNIFVGSSLQAMEWNGNHEMARNRFVRNIVCVGQGETRYQKANAWRDTIMSECNWNVIFGEDLAARKELTPLGDWSAWRDAGNDVDSVLADPCFEDASKDDYRLKSNSPAWKLGFQRIPVEAIGRRGYARPADDIDGVR